MWHTHIAHTLLTLNYIWKHRKWLLVQIKHILKDVIKIRIHARLNICHKNSHLITRFQLILYQNTAFKMCHFDKDPYNERVLVLVIIGFEWKSRKIRQLSQILIRLMQLIFIVKYCQAWRQFDAWCRGLVFFYPPAPLCSVFS